MDNDVDFGAEGPKERFAMEAAALTDQQAVMAVPLALKMRLAARTVKQIISALGVEILADCATLAWSRELAATFFKFPC